MSAADVAPAYDGEHVPREVVRQLLVDRAARAAFRALPTQRVGRLAVIVLCSGCFPLQPDRLPAFDGEIVVWWRAVTERRSVHVPREDLCEGFVRFDLPPARPGEPQEWIRVSDLALIEPRVCCHTLDRALDWWDWLDALNEEVERVVAENAEQWADEWQEERDRLVAVRERREAARAATRAVLEAAEGLTPFERPQAVAGWLIDAGHPKQHVTVDQSRVAVQCGHADRQSGDWLRRVLVIPSDGVPTYSEDSCRECRSAGVRLPSFVALAEKYLEIAALPEKERANYRPAREKQARGGDRPRARKKAPAESPPLATFTDEQVDVAIMSACSQPVGAPGLRAGVRESLGEGATDEALPKGRIDARRDVLVAERRLSRTWQTTPGKGGGTHVFQAPQGS